MLIDLCSNCPKGAECREICEKIEKELQKAGVEPVLQPDYRSKPLDENLSSADTPVGWPPASDEDREKLIRTIEELLPLVFPRKEERGQARQFLAFIQCDPIAKVARMANITKQAMGKRISSALEKMKIPIIDWLKKTGTGISDELTQQMRHAVSPAKFKKALLPLG